MKRESLSAKLGSIAAVVGADGAAVQRVWYFASGLPVTENAATTAVNSRLHIGKEFTAFDGLWWYDNDARQYDPLTMRFTTLDPLAANYPSLSPYAYCANNPVNYIDPDGKQISGYTRGDALEFQKDINTVLSNDKFSEFRKLLVVDDSGVFQKVENYESVLPSQTEDEKAFTSMLVDAINSPEMHTVEYATGDYISSEGSNIYADFLNKSNNSKVGTNLINKETGGIASGIIPGGVSIPTEKGSYSIIGIKYLQNCIGLNHMQRHVVAMHELFGHGIAFSANIFGFENNLNAVRMTNLVLRMSNLPEWDGTGHGEGDTIKQSNPYEMPILK